MLDAPLSVSRRQFAVEKIVIRSDTIIICHIRAKPRREQTDRGELREILHPADTTYVLRDQASLVALTEDVVKTSAIEGELLNIKSVRSSIARRLGLDIVALHRAVDQAQQSVDAVLAKARFWQRFIGVPMNERQIKLVNRLLDGFEGKLTSSKWAAIAKCSPDTALRDINELVENDVLRKSSSGGHSTSYALNEWPAG